MLVLGVVDHALSGYWLRHVSARRPAGWPYTSIMATPAASRTRTSATASKKRTRPTKALVILYLVYAVVFVGVAFYTVLHLVFFGFSGGPVGIDLGAALLLPLAWIVGLLRTIKLRDRPQAAIVWGYSVIAVLLVALVVDTIWFQPILAG
jgi:hypothetical protein